MPDLWETRQRKAEERTKKLKELASRITSNRIDFVLNVILKEVRKEHRLVIQILYALFSIYTPNPLNLAVNAPTGEGKTYGVKNVARYFPADDIQHLGGMSEKSLFHRKGDIVVKEDDDEYALIEKYTEDIITQIDEIDERMKEADTKDKINLRREKRLLETSLERYEAEAIKRINLNQKALVFQDTPDPKLLETIMPLLSHDQPRVFYEFASKNNNGIQTVSNMIEGWPSVIYCQAIDTSGRERWPELLRRFIICNPEMTPEKYEGAIDQIFKSSYTDNKYETEVVTKEEKDTVKGIILDIIETLKEHFVDKNRNAVMMPFRDSVKSSFRSDSAFDVSVASKTHDLLVLLPVVNLKERPYLLTKDEKRIPFCTFRDLEDSLYINEFVFGGLRQYVLHWYISVFYNVWNRKKQLGASGLDPIDKNGKTVMEPKPVARIDELSDRTKEVNGGENLSKNQLMDKYINPLINHGYIDELDSETKKEKVYYPTSHEIVSRYEIKDNTLQLVKKLQVQDVSKYPSKRYIYDKISEDMKAEPDSKLMDVDGTEISIGDLIEKYYSDPHEHFKEYEELTASDIDRITRANTTSTVILDNYHEDALVEYLCENCGKSFTETGKKEHDKYDDCQPRSKSKMLDNLHKT